MHNLWTSHLKTQEEKDKFKLTILSSSTLINRINEILEKKIEAAERERLAEDYDKASWAFKQADSNGVIRTLKEIQQLFNMKGNG